MDQRGAEKEQSLKHKVQRALQNIRQLKNQVSLQVSQREYLLMFEAHVVSMIKQLKDCLLKKSSLDPNIAIKKLELQTLIKKQRKEKWINTENKCKPSQHLKEIFQQKNTQKLIGSLEMKLQTLYNSISSGLQKEEPYIHQKLMQRIRKQTKRQGKLRVLTELNAEIEKRKGWLKDNQKKIEIQGMQKQIENKTVNNLEKMKQLISQKVSINDYIYSIITNQEQENYHLRQFDRLGKILKQAAENQKNRFLQHKSNISFQNIQNKHIAKTVPLNMEQIQTIILDARAILKGSQDQNSQKLMNRIQRAQELTERLNKLI